MTKTPILLLLMMFNMSLIFSQSRISDFKKIDNGIYMLWYDKYENKSVVGEFSNYLILIEFPQNDSLSNEVIDYLKLKFPKKEIKFVSHSHHHSHSISSFEPFLKKTNASLITTKYNYNEINLLSKDTISLAKRYIQYDSVYVVSDKFNRLEFYEAKQSKYLVPTKEYNIFYFPKQQYVVSGCLFNKPKSYYEVVNARKPALKKFLIDNKIIAKQFIPTNTSRANEFEDVCSLETFENALVKGIIPNDFCDNFQSKTIEYLESQTDSLSFEFSKIPRSFDYLVCANTLSAIRKDYNRAIIIFKILTRLYPKEINTYYSIGQCYEAKGAKIEAIAFYKEFQSLTLDESDKKEAAKKIMQLTKQ